MEAVKTAFEAAADALSLLTTMECEILEESPDFDDNLDFYDLVRRFESCLIRRALLRSNGIQVKAARLLNIRPTTLNNKIKQYEINKEFTPMAEAARPIVSGGLKKTQANFVA